MSTYAELDKLIKNAQHITVVQAENPDADSLGSAVALDEILQAQGKTTYLHCAVDVPKYLRYISGWERVSQDWPKKTELVIIVDAGAKSLLEKTLALYQPSTTQTVILDHHSSQPDIESIALNLNTPGLAATGELIYDIARELGWDIPTPAAHALLYSILGDTLGLVSISTTPKTVRTFAELVQHHDVALHELEDRRRELGRKPLKIVLYKQALMQRMQLHFENQLATVEIPLTEIKEYSDLYNPAALFMEELRPAEEIRMAIVFKVYEDRITGKLREINQAPFCDKLAESFGGGGHPFAAGFKVAETDVSALKQRVLKRFYELLQEQSR